MLSERIQFDFELSSIGSALQAVKQTTVWLCYKIAIIATQGFELALIGVQKVAHLVTVIWKGLQPYLVQLAALLATKEALFGMGILASLLILRLALSDDNIDNKTNRYALGLLGFSLGVFTSVCGAQAGFFPQIIANAAAV